MYEAFIGALFGAAVTLVSVSFLDHGDQVSRIRQSIDESIDYHTAMLSRAMVAEGGHGRPGAQSEDLPLPGDSTIYESVHRRHVQYVNPALLEFNSKEYPFAVVADLDLNSRHPIELKWFSYFKRGRIVRHGKKFSVSWDDDGPGLELSTHAAYKNRSMELSELCSFNGWLLTVCDISGLVFKIVPQTGSIFQRWAVADGNGDEPKPFKGAARRACNR